MRKIFFLFLFTCSFKTSWAFIELDPKLITSIDNAVFYQGSILFQTNIKTKIVFFRLVKRALQNKTQIVSQINILPSLHYLDSKKQVHALFSVKENLLQRRLNSKVKLLQINLPSEINNDEDLTEEILTDESLDELFQTAP